MAAELERLLNDLLFAEVKDPRLTDVRVTSVSVSGDLGVATVFFGTLGDDEDSSVAIEAFERARGFLRMRIGQALRLRRVPELRFEHDTSARRGVEISQLIDRVATPPQQNEESAPSEPESDSTRPADADD